MRPRPAAALPGALLAAAITAAAPAGAASIALAPHRAVYDLTLENSPDGETVAATGRMVFEVRESCDAWATGQTLRISETDRDGDTSDTRSDYATWETKDGRSLAFSIAQRNEGKLASTVRGVARRDASGRLTVRFTAPAALVLHLPAGILFPIAHTRAVLEAAAAGRHEAAATLFDGTGTDGAEYTYARILSWGPTVGPAPDRALDGIPSGRIHIAFYPALDHGMTPEYEIGMRYFADGVSDRLDMDFGGFRLRGQLRSLHLLPAARGCRTSRR